MLKWQAMSQLRAFVASGSTDLLGAVMSTGFLHSALRKACRANDLGNAVALMVAGGDPAAADPRGFTAVHHAIDGSADERLVCALLAVAPEAALPSASKPEAPSALEQAVVRGDWAAARCLLERGALPPAAQALEALELPCISPYGACPGFVVLAPTPPALYAPLVARLALTPGEWRRVPTPCPGLAAALPAVLERSEAEAGQLVRRLPRNERQHMQATLLWLAAMQRRHGTALPPELHRRIALAAFPPHPRPPGVASAALDCMKLLLLAAPPAVLTCLFAAAACQWRRSA